MDNKADDWGHFEITLDVYLKRHNISKNRLAKAANLQKTQLSAYCRNQVQRPDLNVLSRMCMVLQCDISDIIRYIAPEDEKLVKHVLQKPQSALAQAPGEVQIYKTAELARELNVHPNTIRFYENNGLISPAPRAKNGYRMFNIRHLYQLKICRCIYNSEWTGRAIRSSALKALEAMRAWDIKKAMKCAEANLKLVEREYAKALETTVILKQWAKNSIPQQTGKQFNRSEAAVLIGVTPEVLRNWERNGLISVPRSGTGKRFYSDREIARLRVIYMLRQTNYSISAIHRSLALHDRGNSAGAVLLLNQPEQDEEITYTSAGDHWIASLVNASETARKMIKILKEIPE